MACKRAARGYFGWVWGSERVLVVTSVSEVSRSKVRCLLTKGMLAGVEAGLHGDDKQRRYQPCDESINHRAVT